MTWKKNAFSFLMWALYLLMTGTALVFTGRVICDSLEMADYFEIVIPAVYLLFTGVIVLGLHWMAVKLDVRFQGGKGLFWLECLVVLALFAIGLFLRVSYLQRTIIPASDESIYLQLAYISAEGQEIPPFSHGAVYFYIWALRLCFLLLGNKAAAAVWLQAVLQMCGTLILYFAVRKMAGKAPAVAMAAFFMLTPYMAEKSLELSPEMLYLFLFSLVMLWISQGVKCVLGWGFWLSAGAMAGVLCYLDVAGFLLLPVTAGVVAMRRLSGERKAIGGILGTLAGFLLGAAVCVFADMMYSGKPVSGIISAWAKLYRWGNPQLSVTVSDFGMVWMIAIILCVMAWGIFSFWGRKGEERFSAWILSLGMAVFLQAMGMFTDEMNGFCYIFFFSTVLAGLGIRESIAVFSTDRSGGDGKADHNLEAAESAEQEGQREKLVSGEETETVEENYGRESIEGTGNREGMEERAAQDETIIEEGEPLWPEAPPWENPSVGPEDSSEKKTRKPAEKPQGKRKVEYIENPLPLPKKHKKRVMDYKLDSERNLNGYDIYVPDDDDFDH